MKKTLKEQGVSYYCRECDYDTLWEADDFRLKGEPICPKCDIDLLVRETKQ
jgi:predicted RNA-binding Zn-ribbon protein involved in translation (DUF1610 family)